MSLDSSPVEDVEDRDRVVLNIDDDLAADGVEDRIFEEEERRFLNRPPFQEPRSD